ncbi:MAG TPA: glycosyltransferase [Sphaerochaeta sp.]|nr:glycosyltransferase [Sphaerochaeta sp.]
MERLDLELLGLSITNVTMEDALDMVLGAAGGMHTMHFVNAHCINVAAKDSEYHKILSQSDALFADGSGIKLAGKWLGTPIIDNVNGTDMFPLLCQACARSGKRLFLLGAAPGITQKVADWTKEHTESEVVAGYHHGFFTSAEESSVVESINSSGADLLLVAMGVPTQEKWIARLRDRLDVSVCMGVGGLFDFYSGSIPRAPKWMRSLGIEWVWRLCMEPRRMWRRYIVGNVVFIVRIARIRFSRAHKESTTE